MKRPQLLFIFVAFFLPTSSFGQLSLSGSFKASPVVASSYLLQDLQLKSLADSMIVPANLPALHMTPNSTDHLTAKYFFNDRNYYLRKSKRQKRTGWIILGSGLALITTGIVVAYNNDDDAIKAGVSLVLISGTGIVTSLVSIPFFVSSARNKRIAMRLTSAIELQKAPVLAAGPPAYPAVSLKFGL